MNSIRGYIILNKKTNNNINLFTMITILVLIVLVILCQVKYKNYYQTTGQVIKNENYYQLVLYLTNDKLNTIKNTKTLIIEHLTYDYKIDSISDEYFLTNDNNYYLKVILNINLKEKDKIINNLIQVKILESNKKIFYYIKDYLMRGV